MSLVMDQDNIWDLIGREDTFRDHTVLEATDLVSLEKAQLKNDAECLNRIMNFSDDGKLQVRFQDTQDLIHFYKMLR